MPSLDQILQIYLDLTDWHERNGPAHVRDRFLILAADAALNAGREDEAERLRLRLLQLNPHHMLKPFASFAEALRSPDVDSYVSDLKHSYPPEVAEEILEQVRAVEAAPPPATPRSTLPLPGTLPVVDLDAHDRPRETPDPVVVYWDDTEARPVPKPVKRPAPAKQPPRPTTVPRTTPRPAPAPPSPKAARPASLSRPVRPLRTELPPAPAARSAMADDEDQPRATWISSGLFGVLLLTSVVLLVYTLGRPLLPPGWLPW